MNTTEQLQALLAEKATGVLESIDVNILFTRFPKSLFNISTCMDWRVDFLPCKAKIHRHPDGWQGFLTQSGRKIRRQDMRGEILNRL